MARCPHCDAPAVRHPSALWRIAQAGAWSYAAISVLGASLVGPFIIALFPILTFGGICLVAETHRRANALPQCDDCGKIVVGSAEHRVPATAARPATFDLASAR
jgi:hypothetical protein